MSILSHQFAVNDGLNFWDSGSDNMNSTIIQYTNRPANGVITNTTPIVLNTTTFTASFTGKICVIGSVTFTSQGANNVPMSVTLSKTNAPTASAVGQATIFNTQSESVSSFLTFNVTVGDTVNLSFAITGANQSTYSNPNWVIYNIDTA